jgi:nitrite reductase/ring-hydroxylating ferredoxin subunit
MNGAAPVWHDVMAADALAPGHTERVECAGRGLFVHRSDAGEGADEWRVYDSRCPHQTTNIPHLALNGHTLTCPKHEWVFDVRSGACTHKGSSPLRRWPSKVEDGRLKAQW